MSDRLESGRWFRIRTLIDQFTRECLLLWADLSLTGAKAVACLEVLAGTCDLPLAITLDNGSEFCSRAMDVWAYQNGVKLDSIRPARPVENGYIESFNGRLCDECLNVHVLPPEVTGAGADAVSSGGPATAFRRCSKARIH